MNDSKRANKLDRRRKRARKKHDHKRDPILAETKEITELLNLRHRPQADDLSRIKGAPNAVLRKVMKESPRPTTWGALLLPPDDFDVFARSSFLQRLPRSASLSEEIRYATCIFQSRASNLSSFLAQRVRFQSYLLTGNYSDAHAVLRQTKDEHGTSFWLAEATMLIAELESGLPGNRKVLQGLTESTPDDSLASLLAFLSTRIELDVPHSLYDYYVRTHCQTVQYELENPSLALFVRLLLAPHCEDTYRETDESHLHEVIHLALSLPLVDCYLFIVRLVHALCASRTWNVNSNVVRHLPNLLSNLHDPQLASITHFTAPRQAGRTVRYDSNYLQSVESYTQGRYDEAIDALRLHLAECPSHIEAYDLLAKACIYSQRDCESPWA
jgi:hypothetical protein